jgi:hypothetical protein
MQDKVYLEISIKCYKSSEMMQQVPFAKWPVEKPFSIFNDVVKTNNWEKIKYFMIFHGQMQFLRIRF